MAGFKTHITTSTCIGVGYGALGAVAFHVPLESAILAGGLCSVSGMLPDLDSDSGVPLRESIAFTAAVVPMFLMNRLKHMGLPPETIVLGGAAVYVMIRFGLAKLLKWYTVHRGMFHSLPAAVIAAELAYLLCTGDTSSRIYKSSAVFLGFMSHLVLDEIWSVEWKLGRWRLKKSFGTAVKLWSKSVWGNFSTYAKLAILTYLVMHDPMAAPALQQGDPNGGTLTTAPKFEPPEIGTPMSTAGNSLPNSLSTPGATDRPAAETAGRPLRKN